MRRWLELAARLYPAEWRVRYGNEFQALLDDLDPGWRELFDVIAGALTMRFTHARTYLKFAAAFALFGAAAALTASFLVDKQYVATATMRIEPTQPPANGTQAFDDERFTQVKAELLSRTALSRLIQLPDLRLYPRDLDRLPLQDVIETMRTRDIRIAVNPTNTRGADVFLSFTYPDERKAKRVVAELLDRCANDFNYHPTNQKLYILKRPDSPQSVEPNRLEMVLIGLAAGMLSGLFTAAFIKHPKPALVFTLMGIGGALAGWGISMFLPQRYVSDATLRITPSAGDAGAEQGKQWLVNNMEVIFSDESLSELFNRRPLDLYREERNNGDPHQLFARVRKKDLSYELVNNSTVLRLRFACGDPAKAQMMIQALITRVAEQEADTRRQGAYSPGSIEVIDNASLPLTSISLNGKVTPIAGLLLGAALATLATRRRAPAVNNKSLRPSQV